MKNNKCDKRTEPTYGYRELSVEVKHIFSRLDKSYAEQKLNEEKVKIEYEKCMKKIHDLEKRWVKLLGFAMGFSSCFSLLVNLFTKSI